MKLFLLKPVEPNFGGSPYDKAHGFVVRAEDGVSARLLATMRAGDEARFGPLNPWLNERETTCEELLPDGPAEVVLRDFNAG